MFCTKCGNQVPDEMRFCPMCGTAVEAAPQPEPEQAPAAWSPYAQPRQGDAPPAAYMLDQHPVDWSRHTQPAAPAQPAARAFVTPTPPAPQPQPAAPKKKMGKAWLWITILAVVVVGLAVAAILLFGDQTVYLVTKQTMTQGEYELEYTYEYDDEGRITAYTYETDGDGLKVSYEYDKSGNLEKAVFRVDDSKATVNYKYKNGVLEDISVKSDMFEDEEEVEVTCNKDGTIKSVKLLEDGEEYQSWSFKYHDNGTVKTITEEEDNSWYSYKTVTHYDEKGRNTEVLRYYDGELYYKTVCEYDDRDNLIRQKSYYEDELQNDAQFLYTYKKDKLQGLTIKMEADDQEVEIIFECEWDGRTCTMTVQDYDGDEEVLDELDGDLDSLEITFEVDKAGNVLHYEVEFEDETVMQMEAEYEKFKLPRKYKKINLLVDPLYMLFLLNL